MLQRFLYVSAQIQQFFKGFIDRALRIVLLEWLLPFVGQLRDLGKRFGSGEAGVPAINRVHTRVAQLLQPGTNGNQIGVHQFNQRAAK